MNNPGVWAALFLAVAVGFGVGEIVLAGSFFLLPFAIGAVVASIVSLMNVGPTVSFPLFLAVSFVVFLGFRPLARRLDADTPDVAGIGSNRLIGVTGSVTEEIPPAPGAAGMVRVGAEDWRADAADDLFVPVGARVRVLEVRGTRLVVEPIGPPALSDTPYGG
jgi:membrane protein implicated in regulation of membrane protease activity